MNILVINIIIRIITAQHQLGDRVDVDMTINETIQTTFNCLGISNQTAITIDWDSNLLVDMRLIMQIRMEEIIIIKDYIRINPTCQSTFALTCLTNVCQFSIYQDVFVIIRNIGYKVQQFNSFQYFQAEYNESTVLVIQIHNIANLKGLFQVYYNRNNELPTYDTYDSKCFNINIAEVACPCGIGNYTLLLHTGQYTFWSMFNRQQLTSMDQVKWGQRNFIQVGTNQSLIIVIKQMNQYQTNSVNIKLIYGELTFKLNDTIIVLNQTNTSISIVTALIHLDLYATMETLLEFTLIYQNQLSIKQNTIVYIQSSIKHIELSNFDHIFFTEFRIETDNCPTPVCNYIYINQQDDTKQYQNTECLVMANYFTEMTINHGQDNDVCVFKINEIADPINAQQSMTQLITIQADQTFLLQENHNIQLSLQQGNCSFTLSENILIVNRIDLAIYTIKITYPNNNINFISIYQGTNVLKVTLRYLKVYVNQRQNYYIAITNGLVFHCYFDQSLLQEMSFNGTIYLNNTNSQFIFIKIDLPDNYPHLTYMISTNVLNTLRQHSIHSINTMKLEQVEYTSISYIEPASIIFMAQYYIQVLLIAVHGSKHKCLIEVVNSVTLVSTEYYIITNNYDAQVSFLRFLNCHNEFIVVVMQEYVGQQSLIQDEIFSIVSRYLYLVTQNYKFIIIQCNQYNTQYYISYQNILNQFGQYPSQEYFHDVLDFSKQNTIKLRIDKTYCELLLCLIRLTQVQLVNDPIQISYSEYYVLVDQNSQVITHLDTEFNIKSVSETQIHCLASPIVGQVDQFIVNDNNTVNNHWSLQQNNIIQIKCKIQCNLIITCSHEWSFKLNDYPLLLLGGNNQPIQFHTNTEIQTQIIQGNPIITKLNKFTIEIQLDLQSIVIINQQTSKINLIAEQIYESQGFNNIQILIHIFTDVYLNLCVTNGIALLQNNQTITTFNSPYEIQCWQTIIVCSDEQQVQLEIQQNSEYLRIYYSIDNSYKLRLTQLNMLNHNQSAQFNPLQFSDNKVVIESNEQFELYQNSHKLHPLNFMTASNTYSKLYLFKEQFIVNCIFKESKNMDKAILLSIQVDGEQPRQLFHNFTMTTYHHNTTWILNPQLNNYHILQIQSDEYFTHNLDNSIITKNKFVQLFINQIDTPVYFTTNGTSPIHIHLFNVPVQYQDCYQEDFKAQISKVANKYELTLPNIIINPECVLIVIEIQTMDTIYRFDPKLKSYTIPSTQKLDDNSIIIMTYLMNYKYLKLQYFLIEADQPNDVSYLLITCIILLCLTIGILVIYRIIKYCQVKQKQESTAIQHIEMQQELKY